MLFGSVAQGGTDTDFARLLAVQPTARPAANTVESIDGWLTGEAADLTTRLCHLQAALGWRSGVLELGVYRGKYLALLAALYEGTGLPLVGVDMFMERINESIASEHVPYMVGLIKNAVVSAAPGSVAPVILPMRTQDVSASALLGHCHRGYSFVSVDAGHEAEDVANDLPLAASVLSPSGIVALDDAFNSSLPGVSEGLFRYLGAAGADGLAAFAACGNKLFLCRPGMHPTYLSYARWLLAAPDGAHYLARTAARDRANRDLGFTPRLAGRELVPFEHSENTA